jgi:hypothetical protein
MWQAGMPNRAFKSLLKSIILLYIERIISHSLSLPDYAATRFYIHFWIL